MYHYCGKDPVHPDSVIPHYDMEIRDGFRWVAIRIRDIEPQMVLKNEPNAEKVNQKYINESDESEMEDESDCNTSNSGEKGKRRRHKERKIGEVLDLVWNWRKLYAGIRDPKTGQTIKYSLDEAAKKVGVAKKSLDDYLLQIRAARKFGFNFQDSKDEKIGILRTFVKRYRTAQTTLKRAQSSQYSMNSFNGGASGSDNNSMNSPFDDVTDFCFQNSTTTT